jgi:hypothetical protein
MWWCIDLSIVQPETQHWRSIERWVKAETGPEAVIEFLNTIDFKDGELIHFMHISRPSKNAPL